MDSAITYKVCTFWPLRESQCPITQVWRRKESDTQCAQGDVQATEVKESSKSQERIITASSKGKTKFQENSSQKK